jgi:serine/threonine protein kinase
MPKRLLVLAGPDEGRAFTIPGSDTLLVGRSRAADACLIDPHVSRVHCQVQVEGDAVVLSDFDSPGGTWVNGQRIAKQPLKAGDLLRIGNTRLQFLDDEAEAPWLSEATAASRQTSTARPAAKATKIAKTLPWPHGLIGEKLGNYKIGAVLAKSHTGFVFHARDVRKDLPVALKVLHPSYSQDEKAVQRFVRAMKTVMPLRHPNLVTVYAAGKSGLYCWIAMEYVPGESLAAVIGRIDRPGRLDWRQVLPFAIYVLRGLAYAHDKGVVHRNITPANILLGSKMEHTKLGDLMLTKALEGDLAQQLTLRGELLGDVPYLAPECTVGGADIDGRADLFSLGANLYALLTGKPPFSGDTATEIVQRIRREDPTRLRTLYADLPEELEDIIHRMLAKRPPERPASAAVLLVEVEKYAQRYEVTLR